MRTYRGANDPWLHSDLSLALEARRNQPPYDRDAEIAAQIARERAARDRIAGRPAHYNDEPKPAQIISAASGEITQVGPAATAPAPKNHGPDMAAAMMGGMGGS